MPVPFPRMLMTAALMLPFAPLAPHHATAQETATPPAETRPEPGIDQFMQGLLDRAQPSLDRLGRDLNGLAERFGPLLGEIGTLMDDAGNYQAPERLKNGDILIRRRADAPPPPPIGPNLRGLMNPAPRSSAPDMPAPPEAVPVPDPQEQIEL